MRYFLIFISILVNSQQVIYQIEAANQPNGLNSIDNIYSDDEWVIFGNENGDTKSSCSSFDVYGGYNVFTHNTVIQKVFFDLAPHFKMKIEMNLWWFDLVLLDELVIENDYTQISITSSSSPQTNSCLVCIFDQDANACIYTVIDYQVQSLVFEFPHSRRNSIFKMFQNFYIHEDATWGFSSFKITVSNCPSECLYCIGYNDLTCGFWSKLQFSFIECEFVDTDIQLWGAGLEENVDEFGGCKGINSISFESSFILPPIDKILIRFLTTGNTGLTIWIDQNRIDIQQSGVVELIVQKQFGSILNVKIRDLNSMTDWKIRDIEIYYYFRLNQIENEIIIPYTILECRELIGQFCLDCQEGWELDVLQNICMTQCGDNIISGFEECDDGNQIQFDGCYQCKLQCIQFCQICIYGTCLQCLNGYSFNNNQECSPNCQDKIIIPYYDKECEGEDFRQFHGCFQCLKQVECIYGCVNCDLRMCYKCQSDFILYQGRCLSNCGRNNGIIYEDCEDFSEENIELLCSPYCITCNLQQCLMCDELYELLEDGSCALKDVDNINQFIQKVDMICQESTFECNYYKSPQLILSYLNITLNKQYVRIEFTEQVKSQLQIPLSSTLIIEIFNITSQMYSYDIIIIQDSGEFVQTIQLILEIEIFELLEAKPVLSLNLNQSLVNSFGQSVIQDSAIITLEFPSYLNENEKRISNRLASIAESSIYALLAVCGISILFGNPQYILVILNMLQYLSILRYLNLKFPQNLEIYFSAYDILTIQPLLNLLPIDLLNDMMFENTFKECSGKFKYYGLNADLITNLYCQILQCLIFLLFGLIARHIKKIIYYHMFSYRYFQYMDRVSLNVKPSIVLIFNKLLYQGIKAFVLQIQQLITYKGIKQLLFLNGQDLIFKILLYLNSMQLSNSRDIIQIMIAIIICTSYLLIFLHAMWTNATPKQVQDNNTFQILNFFKQTLQLYLLIFLDSSEIIQLGLFFITSLVNLRLIFAYRHIFAYSQFVINAIVETSVLLFTLTSFIYIGDFQKDILVSSKIKCGWGQIIILSLGLFSELIVIFKDTFMSIIKKCKKYYEVKINSMPFIV